MTLNGVMAVTLRYFTEFGKLVLQKTMCVRIYASVYCIYSACTMSSQRKFTFAISSPDEFLVRNRPLRMHQNVTFALNIYKNFLGKGCAPSTNPTLGERGTSLLVAPDFENGVAPLIGSHKLSS